mmetsp:Transcript_10697/g.43121  ORF Transcript_10697/g.43121 Transcript_10697/m.43121 type:complete len:247 (+) Transcript_10697:594-1334(+)
MGRRRRTRGHLRSQRAQLAGATRRRRRGKRRHGYNRVGARSRREARRQDAEEAAKESAGVRIHRAGGRHEQGSHGCRVPGRHHRRRRRLRTDMRRRATLGQIRRRRGDSRDANERVHERGRPAGARRQAPQAVRARHQLTRLVRGGDQGGGVHGQPGGSVRPVEANRRGQRRPRRPPRRRARFDATRRRSRRAALRVHPRRRRERIVGPDDPASIRPRPRRRHRGPRAAAVLQAHPQGVRDRAQHG